MDKKFEQAMINREAIEVVKIEGNIGIGFE
jgi:hypothetical protein